MRQQASTICRLIVCPSEYPAATKKPHPVWMRLFAWKLFPLHGRDEEEEAVGHGGEGEEAAGEAYVGDGEVGAEHAAQPGAKADAQVEDAGKDGHGHRSGSVVGDLDGLGLQGHIEGGGGETPEDGDGDDEAKALRNGIEQEEGEGHIENRDGDEAVAVGRVKSGEEEASQKARHAEEGEDHGDFLFGEVGNLQKEGLDVAVAGVVGGGDQEGQEENAGEHGIFEKLRHVTGGEGSVSGNFRQHEEEVGQDQEGNHRHAGEGAAPSGVEADEAAQGQAEDHGDGGTGDNHAHGGGLVFLRHDAHGDGRGDGPEYGVGAGDADAGGEERVVAGGNSGAHLGDREEGHDA